jgi:hypothetical protein
MARFGKTDPELDETWLVTGGSRIAFLPSLP